MIKMEQVSGEGIKKTPLEALTEMSPAGIRERVIRLLTPDEARRFTATDYELVAGIARRFLESDQPDTVDTALQVAVEIRMEALQKLGSIERHAAVRDRSGQVISTGVDEGDAKRRARDMLAGQ